MGRASWSAVILAALLSGSVGRPEPAGAAEAPEADVYVRQRLDVPGTVRWLADEARRRKAGLVLFVFDAVTFAPPNGLTEFSSEYLFSNDLDAWIEALGSWPQQGGVPLRATSSLAPRTVLAGSPGWQADLRELVIRPWHADGAPTELEPATRWLTRLLDRTEVVAGSRSDAERMVVLVAGHLTPERWVPADVTSGRESVWRTKLRPLGGYFDPEAVATVLARHGGTLYAVAPEARFGDATPLPELPDLPWSSRPMLPPDDLDGFLMRQTGGLAPAGHGRVLAAELLAELEEQLRKSIPDPVERARVLAGLLKGLGGGPPPPDGVLPQPVTPPAGPKPRPTAHLRPLPTRGHRYLSATPVWFFRPGAVCLWSNHTPSSWGQWPLARAARASGGRYLFYPFPETPWLDLCPRDDALLARLAPELVPFDRYVRLRAGDPALDAQCRAMALLVKPTPWADGLWGHRAASAWSAFERAAPLRLQPDWFARRRPCDDALQGSEDGLARLGRRLLEEVLPAHDEALVLLDAAWFEVEAGRDRRSHPRSVANLCLMRFWLRMSAFHLAAYAIYASELDRFIPDDLRGHVDYVTVTYVPTIRLSDCLEAYDGRALTDEDERTLPAWELIDEPGYQGNLLVIPPQDPRFRARRSLDRVLLRLDGRLRARALHMIEAARVVMKRYARTGWGWTTYYSDAFTFIFRPAKVLTGHQPSSGGSTKPPPGPSTPQGPGTGPGGSAPGGPATK